MRRFLIGLLATIGAMALIVVAVAGVIAWRFMAQGETLPGRILLTADWRTQISETAGAPDLLDFELSSPPTVTDTVMALDAAAKDPRVAGILVRLAETDHGLAVAQELRDAVRRFRAGGKYAIAYADTFGELGPANEGYYLATAFDEIDLQQLGLVGLTGLAAQVPLARDLLASLGIRLEVLRRAEYKSAFESLTDSEISAPNREQLEALLDTLSGQLVTGIAQGRKLEPGEVRRLIDQGPFTDEAALAAGLIDHVRYPDETLKLALGRAGQGAAAVPLRAYAGHVVAPAHAATVALVRASGLIRRGDGPVGTEIAADELAETLQGIAEDPALDAVLLRIDSGGGSAVASETIRRAVVQVRAAGKPVIVSMSNTAASGGYWIAAGADRIVAQPATLTGSIGVIAGKPVLEEAWRKLGVNWAQVTRGANADLWSINQPYSVAANARVDALVGWLYDQFTKLVAEARGMPQDRVRELARGRVWAGETAVGLGLVDEIGGFDVALAAARKSLQLPPDAVLAIEVRPSDENPLRQFLRSLRPIGVRLAAIFGLLDPHIAGITQSGPVQIR